MNDWQLLAVRIFLPGIPAELRALGAKLKALEPCAAACIEGQFCVTKEPKWVGRELVRIADRLEGIRR